MSDSSEQPSAFLLGAVVACFVFAIVMAVFGWLILPPK